MAHGSESREVGGATADAMELRLSVRRKNHAARRLAHQLVAVLREMSSAMETPLDFYSDHN
jgi:hypothetical protein